MRTNLNHRPTHVEIEVEDEFMTHSIGLSSGDHHQIFVFCLTIVGFLIWGTLFDERMGL
jgi:hypothetical protein